MAVERYPGVTVVTLEPKKPTREELVAGRARRVLERAALVQTHEAELAAIDVNLRQFDAEIKELEDAAATE